MATDSSSFGRSTGTGGFPDGPAEDPRHFRAVTETILRRRSTREQFIDRAVPEQVLAEVVQCGLAAPSSKNAQPWRLHIVSDRALLSELAEAVERSPGVDSYAPTDPLTGEPRPEWSSTVAESASVLRQVAAGIFVENCNTFSRGRRVLIEAIQAGRVDSLIGHDFEILGIGAAIENMWIAAEAFGLRGCYLGDVVVAEEEISRRLGIENDLLGVLALGYSTAPIRPQRLQEAPMDGAHVVWHGYPMP